MSTRHISGAAMVGLLTVSLLASTAAAADPQVIVIPAVSFKAQGGGEAVKTEARKPAAEFADGFVHFWYTPGHWLEWTIESAKAGEYTLTLQYAAKQGAVRGLTINGAAAKGLKRSRCPAPTGGMRGPRSPPAKITLVDGRNVLR